MSTDYVNVSTYALESIFLQNNEWANSQEPNFYRQQFEKQIVARAAFFGTAPISLVTHTIDTVIGVVSGVAAILTGGTQPAINVFTSQHLAYSKRVLASPYVCLLLSINPEAPFEENDGIVARFVIDFLDEIAKECRESDDKFTSEVTSRLSYALLAVSALVARAVDGIIGVIAALFSFCTVSYFDSLNNAAIQGLAAVGIINDLFCCAVKCINPSESGLEFGNSL